MYAKQNGICAYSDTAMTTDRIPKENSRLANCYNISVDRIDPMLGYTKDNIQLVCVGVNLIKYDLKEEDFLSMCAKIALSKKCEKITKKQQYDNAIRNILESDIKSVNQNSFNILLNNNV